MKQQLEKYRNWQKENPEWELICDMTDIDCLYIQWHELPRAERMSWVGTYRHAAKDAFEEFGIKECKFPCMVIGPDLIIREIKGWPEGFCMTVFKTANQSFNSDAEKGAGDLHVR